MKSHGAGTDSGGHWTGGEYVVAAAAGRSAGNGNRGASARTTATARQTDHPVGEDLFEVLSNLQQPV